MEDYKTHEIEELNDKLVPYKHIERRLVTQPYDMSVHTMIQQIKDEDIILDPDYQRKYRWDKIRASRFIESLLLNIPIPNIFLAEEEDMTYSVIDGQQRLTTLYKFINRNEFPLEGLQVRDDLNDKIFDDLSKKDRGKLLKQYLRCSVILNDSDPQIKFDVFERLNSGSAALSEQEIRNCVYRGRFNNLIKELANNRKYAEMLRLKKEKELDMTNVQYVLRFLGYCNAVDDFNGSVKEFLNSFMKLNQNISYEKEDKFRNQFNIAVDNLYDILHNEAFKRYIPDRQNWHGALNNAVFDAEMVSFSKYKFKNLTDTTINLIIHDIIKLMNEDKFIRSIKSSTNSPEKVKYRIRKMDNCISQYGEKIDNDK